MPDIWFTSDTHYGHYNIIKYCNRPWEDTDSMNRFLVENYNSVVKPDDICYFLGDFSLSPHFLFLVEQLNGTKHCVVGNHDKVFGELHNPKAKGKWIPKYLEAGFVSLSTEIMLPVADNLTLQLNHFPWQNESYIDQRYQDKRPVRKWYGQWLLHGHRHGSPEQRVNYEQRTIDVGVDANHYKPLSLQSVLDIIQQCPK
jgi:calcineurin-like phosphoesterase family protein